jgi:hypothetical protein
MCVRGRAQLVKAIKARLLPPQPQLVRPGGQLAAPAPAAGAPAPSALPPWDTVRYVWRGSLAVKAQRVHLELVESAAAQDLALASCPRIAVTAHDLGTDLAGGRIVVSAAHVVAQGHAVAPGQGPGEGDTEPPAAPLSGMGGCAAVTTSENQPARRRHASGAAAAELPQAVLRAGRHL